jgi:hypothetical protein
VIIAELHSSLLVGLLHTRQGVIGIEIRDERFPLELIMPPRLMGEGDED